MDIGRFRQELSGLWDEDPVTAPHPRDRRFGSVVTDTRGMATENKLALLNFACSFLGEDEAYLEIGTYRGTSAIGAALGNEHRSFVAIDNFSQFGGPEAECRENLAKFKCNHVRLVNGDAWAVLAQERFPLIGVFFYDGGHTYREQIRAFAAAAPHLAPEALVIIDDSSHPPVRAANAVAVRTRPDLELLFSFPSPRNTDPRWWNGIDVFAFRRTASTPVPPTEGVLHRWYSLRYGPAYEFVRAATGQLGRLFHLLVGGRHAQQ